MAMKLQSLTISQTNLHSNHTCLAVIILDSALKKDDNYYPQVFLKECKYIEKKLVRHINDNLSDFSCSDESDGEQIKAINFKISENVFFKRAVLISFSVTDLT